MSNQQIITCTSPTCSTSLMKQGIYQSRPKEAREIASFFALIIDTTTKSLPRKLTPTNIRCFEIGCQGTIRVEILPSIKEIHWMCSNCQNEGRITNWQGTNWDNRR